MEKDKKKIMVMTPEEFCRRFPIKKVRKPKMEDIFFNVHLALYCGISIGYWHNAYELSRMTKHEWVTVKRVLKIMKGLGVVDEKIMPINELQSKRCYRLKQREENDGV